MTESVAVIIPTIGRPASLESLLKSIAAQTAPVADIVVADGSGDRETAAVVDRWKAAGLPVRHLEVQPPNAVRQRVEAIRVTEAKYLLLLDDDVELDLECLRELLSGMASEPGVVAVVADFSNQAWSAPTRAWRIYMRYVLGLRDREWEGRVVGPLLRFCHPGSKAARPMEWIGAGTTLVRREAYDKAGGFSDFFLHRCTMNEDVDLGLKLGRVGKILFWPRARLAHHHAPSGRVSAVVAAEDDLFNRYFVLHRTVGLSRGRALWLVLQYLLIETISNVAGSVRRLGGGNAVALLAGRTSGFFKLLTSRQFRDAR